MCIEWNSYIGSMHSTLYTRIVQIYSNLGNLFLLSINMLLGKMIHLMIHSKLPKVPFVVIQFTNPVQVHIVLLFSSKRIKMHESISLPIIRKVYWNIKLLFVFTSVYLISMKIDTQAIVILKSDSNTYLKTQVLHVNGLLIAGLLIYTNCNT